MNTMKVKALAPWFGGKRTLANDIVTELGKHSQYFDPFCASLAVPLAKPPCQKETVGDLHRELINLLWCVADPDVAPVLYRKLANAPFSEELLKEAVLRMQDMPELEAEHLFDTPGEKFIDRAYWFFIASWMGRNGTAGTIRRDYQLAVRWTTGGGSPTVRWKNAVDSMPAWHQRMLNMVILKRDAFSWIGSVEDSNKTAIYCDPPYVIDGTTRTGCSSTGDNGRYVHDFTNRAKHGRNLFGEVDDPDEHERLAAILTQFKHARIVVSYYDCPKIRQLYDGWTFIDKTRQKHLHAQNGRGSRAKDAPEVLIVNGPEYGGSNV